MNFKKGVVVGTTVAVALGLAACGGGGTKDDGTKKSSAGYNAGIDAIVNASTKKGGTLKLGNNADIDSWDPTRSYYAWSWNFQRYYIRTLLTPDAKPGKDSLKLQPDLAQDLPKISDDGKTYTFTLKSGVKFEDGAAITSKDIKYGIERLFAQDVLSGGPPYLLDALQTEPKYEGPYKDTDPAKLGLKSVETPDDKTIVFKLKEASPDFPYLLSMGVSSPVPQAKDTGDKYSDHPVSSGPYKFESIEPGKKVVLVRNTNWDASTDKVRKALPDKIDLTLGLDPNELDNRLLDGSLDADTGQVGVQSAAQAKVLLDANLKKNADAPNTGFIRYVAISEKVAPFDNVHCRKAVQYALDKTAMQTARGGPVAGGDIATNMLPPNIAGHDPKLDPYNTKSGKPQIDKAKQELAACGQPNGFNTVIAVRNKAKEPLTAETLQKSLADVGIKATVDSSDPSLYFRSTIGAPSNVHAKGYGLMLAGWGADYPTAPGYLQVLVDGRLILPSGNNNYSEINNPEINALIDEGKKQTDPAKVADIWAKINTKVMDDASLLPFVYDKALNYRNPRMTNVYVTEYYGMWDFSALGVSDGK